MKTKTDVDVTEFRTCTVSIVGSAPYLPNRLRAGKLSLTREQFSAASRPKAEDLAAHERRTWRSKIHTDRREGKDTVVIPAIFLKQALLTAAQANHILLMLYIPTSPSLGIAADTVECREFTAGKSIRCYPCILPWRTSFNVVLASNDISKQDFIGLVDYAGTQVGIGMFRPETGGFYGSFRFDSIDWGESNTSKQREYA